MTLLNFFSNYYNFGLLAIAFICIIILALPKLLHRSLGVSPFEAIQLLNKNHAIALDLRTLEQFEQGHIAQAQALPFNALKQKIAQIVKNKKTPILLVCENGSNAIKAKKILQQLAYSELYHLEGGMVAWQNAGLPAVKKNKS